MKILVVEDDEPLARVLKEKLELAHFKVDVAIDGEAAFPAAKKFKPDLVLLDLILPKKMGTEVLKDLKTDQETRAIPVMVLSNLDTDEDIKRALAGGAMDYFVKAQHPLKEIVEKVREFENRTK